MRRITIVIDDGVVVGPGFFETVGEFLTGWVRLGPQTTNSDGGCTDATDHPEKIFHWRRLLCSDSRHGLAVRLTPMLVGCKFEDDAFADG